MTYCLTAPTHYIKQCWRIIRKVSCHSPKANLTHWGRVTQICVGKLTIIGSDNGLSPERRQAIIWTNAGILLIGPLGTNFSENWIEIQTFSLKKIHLKMSSAKCCSFCLGINVLRYSLIFVWKLLIQITAASSIGLWDNHNIADALHITYHSDMSYGRKYIWQTDINTDVLNHS